MSSTSTAPATSESTTSAKPDSTEDTATTTPTESTTSESTQADVENVLSYSDWSTFWAVFQKAAASGDQATIAALTTDEITIGYAGGSINFWPTPKDEFLGSFSRPNSDFRNVGVVVDGAHIETKFGPPFDWPEYSRPGADNPQAYEVTYFLDGEVRGVTQYIFARIDGSFRFIGYSRDS